MTTPPSVNIILHVILVCQSIVNNPVLVKCAKQLHKSFIRSFRIPQVFELSIIYLLLNRKHTNFQARCYGRMFVLTTCFTCRLQTFIFINLLLINYVSVSNCIRQLHNLFSLRLSIIYDFFSFLLV